MDNRYELRDNLRILAQDTYGGYWYRVVSYGRFPGVFIAPNVHSELYSNPEKCLEVISELHGTKERFMDGGSFPDSQSQLNPQYTPDGNVAWWCGWAYNGKNDYMAGQYHPGREWLTEEMVEDAKSFVDRATGREQHPMDDETYPSPVEEKKAMVELTATVKLEKKMVTPEEVSSPQSRGDTKKAKGEKPNGKSKGRGHKST